MILGPTGSSKVAATPGHLGRESGYLLKFEINSRHPHPSFFYCGIMKARNGIMTRAGVRRTIAKKKKGGRRARADIVLAQGTGRTVSRAFGRSRRAIGLEGWDAFCPAHLPLPRSVGPYTVTRTTALITSNDRVNIIGCFAQQFDASLGMKDFWTTFGMLKSVNSALAISADNNAYLHTIPFPGVNVTGSGLSAVPAAISVQIMNPNPLQTTSGIVAAAVCPTQLDLRGRAETWADFGTEFISFMRPRLLSAGKLALRGVQMDSYPLNMSALADFRPVRASADITFKLDAAANLHPEGFAPLVIINEASADNPPLELNFLVTVEWRTRFDIGNPAVSSHTHHGVTSDQHWDGLIKQAIDKGAGALDIVERVANTGEALANAFQAVRPVLGRIPMPAIA